MKPQRCLILLYLDPPKTSLAWSHLAEKFAKTDLVPWTTFAAKTRSLYYYISYMKVSMQNSVNYCTCS